MTYQVENVPMPNGTWNRRHNPLTEQLRRIKVGQSIKVAVDDPNLRQSLISNLNLQTKPKHFFKVAEADGVRIFRDR